MTSVQDGGLFLLLLYSTFNIIMYNASMGICVNDQAFLEITCMHYVHVHSAFSH